MCTVKLLVFIGKHGMEASPLMEHNAMNNPLMKPSNYQTLNQPSHSSVS